MKTIIITGGTRGIGADIALKFLNEGWKVFIAARNREGLAKDSHENLVFHAMDVRNEYEHDRLVEKVLKSSGHLDCTINCAGLLLETCLGNPRPPEQSSTEKTQYLL